MGFDKKLPLDVPIDNYAPTLLSLAAFLGSIPLFEYFILKGAEINYVADILAYDEDQEPDEDPETRFWTCLDFAELELADALSVDYSFAKYKLRLPDDFMNVNNKDTVTIKKKEYYDLQLRADYLEQVKNSYEMIEHIKVMGGRNYDDIANA